VCGFFGSNENHSHHHHHCRQLGDSGRSCDSLGGSPHYSRGPREIKGVKDDADFLVSNIYVRAMPCGSAYKDIFNYPAAAPPPHHYRGFTCTLNGRADTDRRNAH
jgi:hypothetical protein